MKPDNVHIENCRSETTSAFRLSPLTSPILLAGTVLAFSVHMLALYIPMMQRIPQVAPIDVATLASLFGLALSLVLVMEIHKWWWRARLTRMRPPVVKG